MQSRASERKWESDRDVSSCSSCDKKFSVSVRKVCLVFSALCVCSRMLHVCMCIIIHANCACIFIM